MDLTPENKAIIDAKSYRELFNGWRFFPIGGPWFQGETCEYWRQRMIELREQEEGQAAHVRASKDLGDAMITEKDYNKAIRILNLAKKQLKPDGNCCNICGDNDHQAWECRFNPLSLNFDWLPDDNN